jgi:myo-inositol-1(or 4)-monophosphatase
MIASLAEIIRSLEAAAREAGSAALGYFRPGAASTAEVSYKEGNSPVTVADHAANDILLRRLGAAFPDFAVISEESSPAKSRGEQSHALIIDPIDGTRGFIEGRPHWCVSVGLAIEGVAVCGIIHAPALKHTYTAFQGGGAFLNGEKLPLRTEPKHPTLRMSGPKALVAEGARIFGSEPFHHPRLPSLALRLVEVATGAVDLAFASQGSHEWDSAAAACILSETASVLIDRNGQPMRFNQPELRRAELIACPTSLVEDLVTDWRLHSAT